MTASPVALARVESRTIQLVADQADAPFCRRRPVRTANAESRTRLNRVVARGADGDCRKLRRAAVVNARKLGGRTVESVGLGCMSLSWAYGTPPSEADAAALLHRALDPGYDHLDTGPKSVSPVPGGGIETERLRFRLFGDAISDPSRPTLDSFMPPKGGSSFGRYRAGVPADRAKFGPAKLPWVRRYRPRLSGTSRVIAASQTPIPLLQWSVARSNR